MRRPRGGPPRGRLDPRPCGERGAGRAAGRSHRVERGGRMIDWLRRPASAKAPLPPVRRSLIVAGRELPVAIRTLRTARRITLRIAPDGSEARITMPPWGRSGEALAFA